MSETTTTGAITTAVSTRVTVMSNTVARKGFQAGVLPFAHRITSSGHMLPTGVGRYLRSRDPHLSLGADH